PLVGAPTEPNRVAPGGGEPNRPGAYALTGFEVPRLAEFGSPPTSRSVWPHRATRIHGPTHRQSGSPSHPRGRDRLLGTWVGLARRRDVRLFGAPGRC